MLFRAVRTLIVEPMHNQAVLAVGLASVKRLIALLSIVLCTSSFALDPRAGMVAAREMGLTNYVEFQNDGRTDSAALFYWRGNWWVYHPSIGSLKTALANKDKVPLVAVRSIQGATGPLKWKPVGTYPHTAELRNGCLPRAIAEIRKNGGAVLLTARHAYALSSRERARVPTPAPRL
jgi:hypothetical protein